MPTKRDDDLGLVMKAAQFAAHKHRDQRRKDAGATPCINHPIGYFDWAKEVVDQVRPANPKLERVFDRLYRQRPGGD